MFGSELDAIVARRRTVALRPDPPGRGEELDTSGAPDAARSDLRAEELERARNQQVESARSEGLRAAAAEEAERIRRDGPPADELSETTTGSLEAKAASAPYPDPDFGLVGLALSGGGIRSATFNLGILQVFAKRGLLRWFDYLSTVSGGGYIGSCLSSTLLFETRRGDTSPLGDSLVHQAGQDEPALLKHLRSGRNYLAPGGLVDFVRIPAVLMRGIVINLLVVFPVVGLLALLSVFMPPFGVFFTGFEFTGFSPEELGRGDIILENAVVFFVPTLAVAGIFVLFSLLYPIGTRFVRRAPWSKRNRIERRFAAGLIAVGVVFGFNLLPYLYFIVFNGSFDTPPWRVAAAAIAAAVPVATSLRNAAAREASFSLPIDKLKLLAAALIGPIIVLSMYLALTHFLLEPMSHPVGDEHSAINVGVAALVDELEGMTAAEIMDQETGTYSRWVNELYFGTTDPPDSDQLYHSFLAAILINHSEEISAALRSYRGDFWLDVPLRETPWLSGLFTATPLSDALREVADPDATVGYADITRGGSDLERLHNLRDDAEQVRKQLVIIRAAVLISVMVGIVLYVLIFVNINKTGLHRFYRDRLSRAYLFDPASQDGSSADDLRISDLDPAVSGGPYHLINAALNIPATDIPALQGRPSDFYMMSPRWCGSSATGYFPTHKFEDSWDEDFDLATAFAISGAAAAPNTGLNTARSLTLILTLLNIRLDYWIPNPRGFSRESRPPTWTAGPSYLLREIAAQMNVDTPYVNLSDGGHIENLGLFELLRRRCKYIVVCDAEQDPNVIFSSLGKLTAYARMADGVWIDWSRTLDDFKKDAKTGFGSVHWALGTIHYGGGKTGRILYIKSSMTGQEWPDMMTYHAQNPGFPQQSTGDQFFDEEQFEAYRALGYLIASGLFDRETTEIPDLDKWFDDLEERLPAATRAGSPSV